MGCARFVGEIFLKNFSISTGLLTKASYVDVHWINCRNLSKFVEVVSIIHVYSQIGKLFFSQKTSSLFCHKYKNSFALASSNGVFGEFLKYSKKWHDLIMIFGYENFMVLIVRLIILILVNGPGQEKNQISS